MSVKQQNRREIVGDKSDCNSMTREPRQRLERQAMRPAAAARALRGTQVQQVSDPRSLGLKTPVGT
jgi:hypothetical protein